MLHEKLKMKDTPSIIHITHHTVVVIGIPVLAKILTAGPAPMELTAAILSSYMVPGVRTASITNVLFIEIFPRDVDPLPLRRYSSL